MRSVHGTGQRQPLERQYSMWSLGHFATEPAPPEPFLPDSSAFLAAFAASAAFFSFTKITDGWLSSSSMS